MPSGVGGSITMKKIAITFAKGDGIGPEIMDATLSILKASNAPLEYEEILIGEKAYLEGYTSGIKPEAWESLRRTGVFLKAPITTPQGGGYKSLNVTVRKVLGLYSNVRPCISYAPFVDTKHPVMDIVIIRENEEDLYAGIEHRQTDEVYQCLKLITRPGCEKIVRYAFEYAKAYNRKKVTCFSKDNIMKMTDGLFHKVFDEIGAEYPEIEKEHWIVDIGAAKLADTPEVFDVIVMPNLYGDILSDVAAQISGSVGIAGSSNIGDTVSMFEAIHGSAPRRAGQNIANPSGLLLGAVQMLVHLGLNDHATAIQNAWLKTIEDGIHTYDIFKEGTSSKKVGTKEFAEAVISNLGKKPSKLKSVEFQKSNFKVSIKPTKPAVKELVGIDIFLQHKDRDPNKLGVAINEIADNGLRLNMITNRGVKVYPDGFPETFCTDHWRCRFKTHGEKIGLKNIFRLMEKMTNAGFEIIKTENLYTFDGEAGYSAGQGQ